MCEQVARNSIGIPPFRFPVKQWNKLSLQAGVGSVKFVEGKIRICKFLSLPGGRGILSTI